MLVECEQLAEAAYAGGRQGLDRPCGDGIGACPFRAEADRQVAHRRLQAGLGQAHDVVVGHGALGTQVGQRQQGAIASLHHRPRGLGKRGKAVGADLLRDAKGVACEAVEEITVERIAWRVGDRMHKCVQPVPVLAELIEQGRDLPVILDVERKQQCAAELACQLCHTLEEALVLVSERELGAFAMHGLGNAVCNRAVAQQTSDQDSLADEKAH